MGGLAARTDAQVFGVGVRRLASLRRATNREHIAEKLLSPDSPLFSDGRFVRKKQRPSLGLPGVPRRLEFPHRRAIGPMASDSATVGQPFASLPPSSWPLSIRQHSAVESARKILMMPDTDPAELCCRSCPPLRRFFVPLSAA